MVDFAEITNNFVALLKTNPKSKNFKRLCQFIMHLKDQLQIIKTYQDTISVDNRVLSQELEQLEQ